MKQEIEENEYRHNNYGRQPIEEAHGKGDVDYWPANQNHPASEEQQHGFHEKVKQGFHAFFVTIWPPIVKRPCHNFLRQRLLIAPKYA